MLTLSQVATGVGILGGLIAIAVGGLTILGAIPRRMRLATTYGFTSLASEGNVVTLMNLSEKAVPLMHWELAWVKRWRPWLEREIVAESEYDPADPLTLIGAHASYPLIFRDEDHFAWGAKCAAKGRLILRVYIAPHSTRPRQLLVYDPRK